MTTLPPPHHSTSPTYPLPGLLAALPSSLLLRRAGTRPHAYWGVTAALASSFALLSLLPSYGAQLCAALIFGPIRCLQWACYFQVSVLRPSHPLYLPLTESVSPAALSPYHHVTAALSPYHHVTAARRRAALPSAPHRPRARLQQLVDRAARRPAPLPPHLPRRLRRLGRRPQRPLPAH